MTTSDKSDRLERLAEHYEHRSWADFNSVSCDHPLLSRYIACYTYSIGCLRERDAKLITRAYPTVMTQIYFEFHGGLSEIRGEAHGFGQGAKSKREAASPGDQASQGTVIGKRTYIKLGLGRWFDIYQLACKEQSRPIKNLKVDLYPMTLYELFQCAPKELADEDLQLADLLGHTTTSLMLEEMEATHSGEELIRIVERYFLQHLEQQIDQQRLEIYPRHSSTKGKRHTINPKGFTPPLPNIEETLPQQAQQYNKSKRWLQKRYDEVYGMSFKQIQSNLRFQHAHQKLWLTLARRQPISLTELAYRSGYFDQAHFIKDFKRYTGMTPGQYLKTNFDQQSQYLWYW
ncbi:MAG: helix-turn-helix transcriptional regulator [Candidatus Thiodiazotropha endolucinida]